jgi:ubiquinone/menaquinone biosynthesis C-methylase UbiE
MSDVREFHVKSYKSHADHYNDYVSGGEKDQHSKTWLETDTVDAWRHKRMYGALDSILKAEPHAKWLTVGDGRYGTDANYILNNGGDAVATDISDLLLKEAQVAGFITEFSKENAESLSFEDVQFDYVLCKEAFHHFPRPFIALYEMLRVAARGVVLIEPNDSFRPHGLTRYLFTSAVRSVLSVLSKRGTDHTFEDSGNYVYSISKRELEKVALGMNYRTIAIKGYNDYYQYGAEFEKLSSKGRIFKKIRLRIRLLDLLTRLYLLDYGMLAAIIFKQKPSAKLVGYLKSDGFEIIELPENPYIPR